VAFLGSTALHIGQAGSPILRVWFPGTELYAPQALRYSFFSKSYHVRLRTLEKQVFLNCNNSSIVEEYSVFGTASTTLAILIRSC
jgi:hypothetical protein